MRLVAAPWSVCAALALAPVTSARAQTAVHGFVQGNYALRAADADCPSSFDCGVMRAEERLQLKLDHASSDGRAGALARVDLFHDALRADAGVDVRELSADVNLGRFSARLGRQVVTWGLGELLFINDVFPKDWVAFLTGAPLEYLKLGSDALRLGIYPPFANAEVVVSPVLQPDRVPSGSPLFFFDPMPAVTDRTTERPAVDLGNVQVSARLYRGVGRFEVALYASRGFYGTPGARPDNPAAPGRLILFYPQLATYGASLQGPVLGGLLSLESGYYESLQDRAGTDPSIENSQARGLLAYQLQPWTDGSLSVQYYVEAMMKHDAYGASLPPGLPARDRYRHVTSVRLRQLGLHQTLQLGFFGLVSPSDQDLYLNPSVRYQVTDELWAEAGGNVFSGQEPHTFFGQFEKNSHVYVTARYAF